MLEEKQLQYFGSGFNHIFPDKKVFNKILENDGAVITEYEENINVFAQGFRDRNRIVAGLSIGTLVVEAKYHSGTGITAEYVNKFNRHLFCIPHTLDDASGVGTNRLIKKGAELITCTEDILKYFKEVKTIKNQGMSVEVPEEYRQVFKQLSNEPLNCDEISKKANMQISEVNTILTMLELEGFIENIPGNYYIRRII